MISQFYFKGHYRESVMQELSSTMNTKLFGYSIIIRKLYLSTQFKLTKNQKQCQCLSKGPMELELAGPATNVIYSLVLALMLYPSSSSVGLCRFHVQSNSHGEHYWQINSLSYSTYLPSTVDSVVNINCLAILGKRFSTTSTWLSCMGGTSAYMVLRNITCTDNSHTRRRVRPFPQSKLGRCCLTTIGVLWGKKILVEILRYTLLGLIINHIGAGVHAPYR